MHASQTRANTNPRMRTIVHPTGRRAYVAELHSIATSRTTTTCPHADGHRSIEAARKCAHRMWRQLPGGLPMKTATTAADYLRAAEYHQKRAGDYTEDAYAAWRRITPGTKPGPASPHAIAAIDSATSASDRADRAAESAKEVEDRGGDQYQIDAAQRAAYRAAGYARSAAKAAHAAVQAALPAD